MKKPTRRQFIGAGGVAGAGLGAALLWPRAGRSGAATPGPTSSPVSAVVPQTPMPGSTIPQFATPLPTFVGARVDSASYTTRFMEFQQKVLPASVYAGLRAPFSLGTYVWGHKNGTQPPHWPGHTTIAHRGTPTQVTYVNNLPRPGASKLEPLLTMDQTLMWANPLGTPPSRQPYQGTIPTVTHLHGSEVLSDYDGTMNEWFTQDGIHGKGYRTAKPTSPNAAVYQYPNTQPPLTMFFHDHARGITRTNVYAGLVSQYWLRDQFDTGLPNNPLKLPAGNFEIEMTIQDRFFDTNGQLLFPSDGTNAPAHPFWNEDFFGDVICVNGAAWPFLNVEPRRYRFRMLNFSNMRFYRLWLADSTTKAAGPPIWQIGTDGGLLDKPIRLSADPNDDAIFGGTKLLMGTTERADVIIDFTGLAGHNFTLMNNAPGPFPDGDPGNFDPATSGMVMQFKVNQPLSSPDNTFNPASGGPLRGGANQLPAIVRLGNPSTGAVAPGVNVGVHRQLIFIEDDPGTGSLEYLNNNQIMDGFRQGTTTVIPGSVPDRANQGMHITELPRVGDTEVWEIFNLTDVAHSVHIHLIQFQVLNRQTADSDGYTANYSTLFPGGTFFGQNADGSIGTQTYPPGVFIPGYGSPLDYNTPNADGAVGGNPAFSTASPGPVMPPEAYEQGWKDVFHVLPGVINRCIVRFSPQDIAVGGVRAGQNKFAIDPTTGPGYVWHCHMFEHEDNELMHSWICNP